MALLLRLKHTSSSGATTPLGRAPRARIVAAACTLVRAPAQVATASIRVSCSLLCCTSRCARLSMYNIIGCKRVLLVVGRVDARLVDLRISHTAME